MSEDVSYELNIEIQNKIGRVVGTAIFQFGIVTSSEFRSGSSQAHFPNTCIRVSDNQNLFLLDERFSVFPESWESISFYPCTDGTPLRHGEVHKYIIQIYREFVMLEFPFSVRTDGLS